MPWTNLPNGISLSTATGAVDGIITGGDASINTLTAASATINGNATITGDASIAGTVVAAHGSVYGPKVAFIVGGTAVVDLYSVAVTSSLYDSGAALRVPFKCVAEIIHIQGATTGINRVVRVTATSVSTGAAVTTLTVASVSNAGGQVNTAIGATALGQGSFIHITSAVTASVNSAEIMINLIPVA